MNEKYAHLDLKALDALLEKKLAQRALTTNNKFNLKTKCLELNSEITELRKQISKKKSENLTRTEEKDNVK